MEQNNNYYSQERPEMLAFLPADFKTVLDLGCGAGFFSASIKKRFPAVNIWGVERDERSAAQAKEKLDKVYCSDLLEAIDDLPDNFFDVIVCNDILEHLADPFSLIIKLKQKLSSGGRIISSIPNVRYLPNLKKLLIDKQWRYEDEGILDRTHLRFFTAKSIKDMFVQAGYQIETFKGINAINSWKFNLLNIISLGYLSDTRYLQFACVVKL